MKVVSYQNNKSGVGKTIGSINHAVGLANKVYGVLLVDIEPQAKTSNNFIKDASGVGDHALTMLLNPQSIANYTAALLRKSLWRNLYEYFR